MKNLILVLTTLLVFTLSSCIPKEDELFDYSDFPDNLISTHEEAETISENRYIVYYYGTYCGHCANIKQDILSFFSDFEALPFYIFNIDDADGIDVSSLQEFRGTPTLFIMSDNEVFEYYLA